MPSTALAVRNNRTRVNVYGGSRPSSGLVTRLRNLSAVNINNVTKSKAKKVIFSLLYSIILLGIIIKLISIATADDIGTFRSSIESLSRACISSLNTAVDIAKKMERVPQSVINMGAGSVSSIFGNVLRLERPKMRRAAMAGAGTALAFSMIPARGTALSVLTGLRNTVTPSKRLVSLAKILNSTAGRAIMTVAGLKTTRQYYVDLSVLLTRYLVTFAAGYGINMVQTIREFKKFRNLPNNLKMASLLTENERLRIAGGVLNSVRQISLNNRPSTARNTTTRNNAVLGFPVTRRVVRRPASARN